MELISNNVAKIVGKSMKDFEYYHEIMGENFYKVTVIVERKSGVADILPVIVSEKLICDEIKKADIVSIDGQVRTHNKENGGMDIFIFARDIERAEENTNTNSICIKGYLCKKGKFRETNSSRKVIDFILAVNRRFQKSDYLPIIAWGKDAKFINNKGISSQFKVVGRFQSRQYTKRAEDGTEIQKIAYEISSSQILIVED